MKKLLLLSILLTACSSNSMSANEELEKKVMCAGYKDEIQEELKQYNYGTETSNTSLFLDEIFYSPTRNSCLYSAWGRTTIFSDSMNEGFDTFYIFDALSSEELYSSTMNCDDQTLCVNDPYEAGEMYSKEVRAHKGLDE